MHKIHVFEAMHLFAYKTKMLYLHTLIGFSQDCGLGLRHSRSITHKIHVFMIRSTTY